jgi:DNA-binding transcriptional regulator YiaG
MTPDQIKAIRHALGLTQSEFATTLGATQVTVSRWETGLNPPRGAYLRMLQLKAVEAGAMTMPPSSSTRKITKAKRRRA